jgi:hypothetical protein
MGVWRFAADMDDASHSRCFLLGCTGCLKHAFTRLCSVHAVVRRERRFAQLPFTSLQDLMCCRNVYGVALFVHKCMQIVDAAAVAAARQQPR